MKSNSKARVKITLQLGSDELSVVPANGDQLLLSQQIAAMKKETMDILKDFILKNQDPIDVPDETIEDAISEEDEETSNRNYNKSKK
ncbi:hypothetical protein ZOSMA_1G03150 [Zostera marina]|uniref:Uncharacterized protein n=1 Tax=Zostera marina TaxID=29655 RepID=A0A0K9PMZ8_ZOSMR|nr:hypothetical protein ZOSMA_1G03150 [Zostera marina]